MFKLISYIKSIDEHLERLEYTRHQTFKTESYKNYVVLVGEGIKVRQRMHREGQYMFEKPGMSNSMPRRTKHFFHEYGAANAFYCKIKEEALHESVTLNDLNAQVVLAECYNLLLQQEPKQRGGM